MYLAEARLDRDYYKKIADILFGYVENTATTRDKVTVRSNASLIEENLEKFEIAYKSYQNYAILVDRAEHAVQVEINDTVFSLKDAIIFRDALRGKLSYYERLLLDLGKDSDDVVYACVDFDTIFKKISELMSDIKTMSSKIDVASWSSLIKDKVDDTMDTENGSDTV